MLPKLKFLILIVVLCKQYDKSIFVEFPHSDTRDCTFHRIGLYFCFFIAIYDDYSIANNIRQHFFIKKSKYCGFFEVLLIFTLNIGKIQLSKIKKGSFLMTIVNTEEKIKEEQHLDATEKET